MLSVLLRFTASDYPFGILWSLCCLAFFDSRLLITPLVSCCHCVVWPSSIRGFWLPLWYLVAIVLSDLLRFTASDYPFGILWQLCCLAFFDSWLLITPLVSCGHYVVWPSSIQGFWLPPFGIFKRFLYLLVTDIKRHLQQYVSVHTYWLQILNVTYNNMSVFTLTGYRYLTSLTTICQCSHLLVTDIKRHSQQYVSVHTYWLQILSVTYNNVSVHTYWLQILNVTYNNMSVFTLTGYRY